MILHKVLPASPLSNRFQIVTKFHSLRRCLCGGFHRAFGSLQQNKADLGPEELLESSCGLMINTLQCYGSVRTERPLDCCTLPEEASHCPCTETDPFTRERINSFRSFEWVCDQACCLGCFSLLAPCLNCLHYNCHERERCGSQGSLILRNQQ